MDLQLAFNKDQHKESTFRFLYDHLSVLEKNMEGFEIAGKEKGIHSVDWVHYFIQDNRANDNYDHTLNYLLSLYEQFKSYHDLLKDARSIISISEFNTLCARVHAFRSRYVKKIAETIVNRQQAGYALEIHAICITILVMEGHLLPNAKS